MNCDICGEEIFVPPLGGSPFHGRGRKEWRHIQHIVRVLRGEPAIQERTYMGDVFKPSPGLLCKLGSIAVHVEEMLSPDGHGFDRIALEQLLNDEEVKAWLAEMDKLAMIPKKRK